MSYTYEEIRSQSAAWRATLEMTVAEWPRLARSLPLGPEVNFLFVGSGTSLYVAQTAAHSVQEVTGRVARAVASSDVFLSGVSVLPRGVPVVAFVISRSGETSEAVMAAEHLVANCPDSRVVALTCNGDTQLARSAHHSLNLPHAAERSVVMTRSFTSMVIALQAIAALIAGNQDLLEELRRLPDLLDLWWSRFEEFGQAIGTDERCDQFIYLGLGPNEGLAEEATLKLKEMTRTTSEAYNPLEFRHGPISIVREGTAVVLLEGIRERAYMADLEADLKGFGAMVATIAPFQPSTADRSVELPGGLTDVARCALYMPPLQLIAYHRAVAAGLDPDQPRNLTQVVRLAGVPGEQNSG